MKRIVSTVAAMMMVLAVAIAPFLIIPAAHAAPSQVCQFDPTLGQPNPLGMRSLLTLTEDEGNTSVLLEVFPSYVGSFEPVTIRSSRTLLFYETGLEAARQLMLQDPTYYTELTGDPDPQGFSHINAVLICRQPQPVEGACGTNSMGQFRNAEACPTMPGCMNSARPSPMGMGMGTGIEMPACRSSAKCEGISTGMNAAKCAARPSPTNTFNQPEM
ncbi:MAG: hypothetical protein AB4042_00130 [Leptolyngbyaceae cyanobacterium]